jgi:hypothetical protein
MDAAKYLAICQNYVEREELRAWPEDWKNITSYFGNAKEHGDIRNLTEGAVELICKAYFDGRTQGAKHIRNSINPLQTAQEIRKIGESIV